MYVAKEANYKKKFFNNKLKSREGGRLSNIVIKMNKKNECRGDYQSPSGITLVTLVVTIIVLLILAGITINFTLGDNGIISRAKKAVEKYKQAEENEIEMLTQFGNEIKIEGNTETNTNADIEELMNKLADLENKYTNLNEKYENIQNEMNEKDNRTLEQLETRGSYR